MLFADAPLPGVTAKLYSNELSVTANGLLAAVSAALPVARITALLAPVARIVGVPIFTFTVSPARLKTLPVEAMLPMVLFRPLLVRFVCNILLVTGR